MALLDLENATISVTHTYDDGRVEFTILAHRDLDVFEILITDTRKNPSPLEIIPRYWRNSVQPLVAKDKVFHYEENLFSAFNFLNIRGGLDEIVGDPLAPLSYGSVVAVQDCRPIAPLCPSFQSAAAREHRIIIASYCSSTGKDDLLQILETRSSIALETPTHTLEMADKKFWKSYWEMSYIKLKPDSRLQPLLATWRMNRFLNACSMEGYFPPKFNGSLFLHDHDRRYWGGAYWFQNTRLQYWPLLKSGPSHYLKPFFDLYFKAKENSRQRVSSCYGHEGVVFPETMHFWGAPRAQDAENGKITNEYIENYFGGSLELVFMMLQYMDYQQDNTDAEFASQVLHLGIAVVQFFFAHFPIRDGLLCLDHSAALETWWDADNPADQIAGLRAVIPQLIHLAETIEPHQVDYLKHALAMVPPLPRGTLVINNNCVQEIGLGTRFIPAQRIHHTSKENYEDPELYAIWPYSLLGKGLPDYSDALESFKARIHTQPRYGWSQTAIWAARLGLADQAAKLALEQFDYSANYPGGMFTSPGYTLGEESQVSDCPYFDTPGAIAMTLQEMLVQDHAVPNAQPVRLLPAWPVEEPVSFKLHTRFSVVEHHHMAPFIDQQRHS
jgi:alpha-L-fucosidase 2